MLLSPLFSYGQDVPCENYFYEGFVPFCATAWEQSGEESWTRFIDVDETLRDIYAEVTIDTDDVIHYHITVQCVTTDEVTGNEMSLIDVFGYSTWTKGDNGRNNVHCPGEITFVDSPELIRTAEEFIGLPKLIDK